MKAGNKEGKNEEEKGVLRHFCVLSGDDGQAAERGTRGIKISNFVLEFVLKFVLEAGERENDVNFLAEKE